VTFSDIKTLLNVLGKNRRFESGQLFHIFLLYISFG